MAKEAPHPFLLDLTPAAKVILETYNFRGGERPRVSLIGSQGVFQSQVGTLVEPLTFPICF